MKKQNYYECTLPRTVDLSVPRLCNAIDDVTLDMP